MVRVFLHQMVVPVTVKNNKEIKNGGRRYIKYHEFHNGLDALGQQRKIEIVHCLTNKMSMNNGCDKY